MSRQGSHKASPTNRVEDKAISAIDREARTKAWLDTLTPEEVIAFKICWCVITPYDKYTRDWAERKVRACTRSRYVGKMAAKVFLCGDDIEGGMQYVQYFVPAAHQKIELEANVNNHNMNCNFTAEDLKDDAKLKAAYAAMFGEPPMIED